MRSASSMRRPRPLTTSTPRHQVSITTLMGRAKFEEGDPDIGVNEIRTGISRAWLTSLSWRYLPGPRFAITQRLYSTGLRFENDNRDGATLDTARSTELGWRADASFSPVTRLVDRIRRRRRSGSTGRSAILRQSSADEQPSRAERLRRTRGSRLRVRPGPDRSGLATYRDAWHTRRPLGADPMRRQHRRGSMPSCGFQRTRAARWHRHLSPVSRPRRRFTASTAAAAGLQPERALHVDAGVEHTLPRQTRLLFNVYTRHERDVLWTPGSEPRLTPAGTISPGSFDAPWVNALRGEARGAEIVVRRDATDGFSGWAGYAFGRLRYTDTRTGESFWADADQRHTLSLYGNYRLSSRASVSARYRYGSNYPVVGYIGEPSASLGQNPVDGRPSALLRAHRPAQYVAAACVFAPGRPRGSRLQLVGPSDRAVRRRRERVESHERAQRQLFRRPRRTGLRDDGVAHADRSVRWFRDRVLRCVDSPCRLVALTGRTPRRRVSLCDDCPCWGRRAYVALAGYLCCTIATRCRSPPAHARGPMKSPLRSKSAPRLRARPSGEPSVRDHARSV